MKSLLSHLTVGLVSGALVAWMLYSTWPIEPCSKIIAIHESTLATTEQLVASQAQTITALQGTVALLQAAYDRDVKLSNDVQALRAIADDAAKIAAEVASIKTLAQSVAQKDAAYKADPVVLDTPKEPGVVTWLKNTWRGAGANMARAK